MAQRTTGGANAGVAYLHGDHLGSVSVLTNASGAVVSRQNYGPWGTLRNAGVTQTTRNFTGQRLDGMGLLYYHARMYDPAIGRFVSADDIGITLKQPQTINRYSYTLNNPLNYTDPTGHCTSDPRTPEDVTENENCQKWKQELLRLEFLILYDDWNLWMAWEMLELINAVNDFLNASGWKIDEMKAAFGAFDPITIRRQHAFDPNPLTYANTFSEDYIEIYDFAFTSGKAKRVFVHEMAHVWDFHQGNLATWMASETGSSTSAAGNYIAGNPEEIDYRPGSASEDFASAVATAVYGIEDPNKQDRAQAFRSGVRRSFIHERFRQGRRFR